MQHEGVKRSDKDMKPKLRIHADSFSEDELQAWRKGDYSLVKGCSRLLKRRLRDKACARPGRRFFGESKVLATHPYEEAWYGSFKWLTSSRWSGDQKLADRYQVGFRDALKDHFHELAEFQQTVALSMRRFGGDRPVGPDLWLITPKEHRFIEVKLPGDRLARHQLVGLALIAVFLRADRGPVSVEVVNLFNGERARGVEQQLEREFARICEQLQNCREADSRSVK